MLQASSSRASVLTTCWQSQQTDHDASLTLDTTDSFRLGHAGPALEPTKLLGLRLLLLMATAWLGVNQA